MIFVAPSPASRTEHQTDGFEHGSGSPQQAAQPGAMGRAVVQQLALFVERGQQ
jgi:hypothetical protein